MNTITLNYDLNSAFDNVTIQPKPVILKGATTVNISLTGVSEEKYTVDVITIDWGDGEREVKKRDLFFNYRTQSIFNEILYGKTNGTALGIFSHDYVNRYNSYEVDYTISVVLLKNNGQYIYIKQPVRCFWGSFYDNMERVTALNSQLLPLNTNDTLLNLESRDSGIITASLRDTGVPLLSGVFEDIGPIDLFGFMEPGYLATSDRVDIEITLSTDETYLVDIVLGFETFDPYAAGF
jgi:hypothetical protein